MSKKKEKKGNANLKWGIALIVEIIVLVIMVVVYAAVWFDKKVDKIDYVELDETKLAINEGANEAQKGYTTIALFGIDSRDVYSMGEGNRSDSIMIASINNDTKEVRIVSIYRDSLLELADGSGLTTKITHAYAYGGPELAIQTLNANLDLEITEFVTVNFLALSKAIDDLGGISIYVQDAELPMLNACITEQINVTGIYSDGVFQTGEQLLNGTQATAWARIRSTDQGDITRTERQRTVISKMVEKAKASDMNTINNIIDDVFPNVSTSLTKDELLDLAKSMFEYELGSNSGFPYAYALSEHETKGSIIVPADLTGNVSALHRFLFESENYTPTQSVQNISSKIQAETGIGAMPIDLTPILGQ